MFGNLYELGPQRVHDTDSGPDLEDNPWAWNRRHMALLFIDQPIGTGFSLQGHRDIPTDEATVAADLYVALQQLWKLDVFKGRSLLIAGESYAGGVMVHICVCGFVMLLCVAAWTTACNVDQHHAHTPGKYVPSIGTIVYTCKMVNTCKMVHAFLCL